jgi:uncharacterized protein (DUF302 family)
MKPEDMFLESESPFDFEETLQRITKAVEVKGWKMPALHNLQQTLRNFGKEVLPVSVFEICHPKHSGRILEKDNERSVSSLMPCRISVFMRSDGKTYISRLNSGVMAAGFGGLIAEVMADATKDVEDIISFALEM